MSASSSSRECVPPSRFFSIRSTTRIDLTHGQVGDVVAGEGGRHHWLTATQIDARCAAAEPHQQLVWDDAGRFRELVQGNLVVALAAEDDHLVTRLDVGQM